MACAKCGAKVAPEIKIKAEVKPMASAIPVNKVRIVVKEVKKT